MKLASVPARLRPMAAAAAGRQPVWFAVAIGLAAVSRLLDLGSRALHHDESIHAATALQRLFDFPYVYDPLYHGPFLYFAVALVFALTDIGDGAARLLPAISGIALVCAVGYLLRDGLGRYGTPLAMLGLTLSTAFLYYSRFLRNDIFIALLTLLAMAALYRYLREPRRRWVLLAATAFGISLVTKENAYISGFIFTVALAGLGVAALLRRQEVIASGPGIDAVAAAMKELAADRRGLVLALAAMAAIPIALYSSFGVNLELVPQAFYDSVAVWAEVHQSGRIDQPWFFYPALTLLLEPWAAVFGVAGILLWIRRPDLLAGLLLWWLAASFAIYTVAGEKAAWLALHPLLPTYLLAAWASDRLLRQGGGVRLAALVLGAALLVLTARHSIATTFLYGDVPRTPIAYSQTSRDIPAAVALFEQAGDRSGYGWALPIHVGQAAHWPFVWYLRGYSAADFYYGRPDPADLDQAVLLLSEEQAGAFDGLLGGYVAAPIRIRVWFPEHVYRSWTWDSVGAFITEPAHWRSLAEFVISHEPPAPIGSTEIYLYLREDLVRLGLDPAQAQAR